ncbi:MAG: hypothetical protein ACI9PP_000062 [Halobacteriales archaeon]|jgi:hypothetical protein
MTNGEPKLSTNDWVNMLDLTCTCMALQIGTHRSRWGYRPTGILLALYKKPLLKAADRWRLALSASVTGPRRCPPRDTADPTSAAGRGCRGQVSPTDEAHRRHRSSSIAAPSRNSRALAMKSDVDHPTSHHEFEVAIISLDHRICGISWEYEAEYPVPFPPCSSAPLLGSFIWNQHADQPLEGGTKICRAVDRGNRGSALSIEGRHRT